MNVTGATRRGASGRLAGCLCVVVLALTAVPPPGLAAPGSLCVGLDDARCAELGSLVAELSALARDEQGWTAIPAGASPLTVITEASRDAVLIDEEQWPAEAQVSLRLLDALKSALEEHVDRRTRAWEDDYFEHLRWYNTARTFRHDLEAVDAERTALETSLRHAENRIRILEGLFFQSIAGIGTGVVVTGHETWTEQHTITDFRNRIVERLAQVAAVDGGPKLVFSYSEVRDGQLLTDLVEEYRGGRVEAFESDPYCISERAEHYCVQMFRIYPELIGSTQAESPPRPGVAEHDRLQSAQILDSLSDPVYLNSYLAEADDSQDVVRTMLDRVSAYNRRSVATLAEVEAKYRREISANQTHRRELEQRLEQNERQHRELLTAIEAEVAGETEAVRAGLDGSTVADLVASWVRRRADLLDRFLGQRDYIAYTVRREFLHAGQLSDDLRRMLVADALEKLDERRRHFLTSRFARVDAGVLQDYTIAEFYREGRISSFLLPLYLRSYPQRAQGGGTETQESLLLALRITFDRRQVGSAPLSVAQRRPDRSSAARALAACQPAAGVEGRFVPCTDRSFVWDRDQGLVWATGSVTENVLYRQFERRAAGLDGLGLQGWRLPTARELQSLADDPAAAPWRRPGQYWTAAARGSGMDVRVSTVWLPSGSPDERAADNIATGIAVLDVD
jgi:hypothetical protein